MSNINVAQFLSLSVAEQEAILAKANQGTRPAGRIKVSTKGGVSVYGLGRFPVTLYKSQWDKLFAMTEEIKAFLEAHSSELTVKEKQGE